MVVVVWPAVSWAVLGGEVVGCGRRVATPVWLRW